MVRAAALVLCLAACGQAPAADYTLFFYPAGAGGGAIITPGFDSLEMCRLGAREAKMAYLRLAVDGAAADYECGSGCRVKDGITTFATCVTTEH